MTTAVPARLRWINLAAAVLLLICTGSIYAFSVFSGPLAELRGWSGTEAALGFTIAAAVSPIPMIVGGKLVDLGYARAAFLFGILGVGIAFGGIMGVFPALCIEQFGSKNFGTNYGILFTGYSIAALVGPRLGAAIGDANDGDFDMAFIMAALISLVGAGVAIAFRMHSRRPQALPVTEK